MLFDLVAAVLIERGGGCLTIRYCRFRPMCVSGALRDDRRGVSWDYSTGVFACVMGGKGPVER